MKEKILEAFKALGFVMEYAEGLYYAFQYEGKHFLYLYDEDDEDFLDIAIPGVLDIDDIDDAEFYQLMDKLNDTMRYVKAYKANDSMWLFYERELFGGEDLQQVISNMIQHLDASFAFLRETMNSSEEYDDNTDDDTDNDTDSEDKEDAA